MNLQKRTINNRPIFFISIFLLLGIVFAREFLDVNILCLVFTSVIFLLLIVFAILKKDKSYICVIFYFLALCLGIVLFYFSVNKYPSKEIAEKQTISCHIEEKIYHKDETFGYLATNVNFNGSKNDGNIIIYVKGTLTDENEIKPGHNITFLAKPKSVEVENYLGVSSYFAKYGVNYSASTTFDEVFLKSYEPNLKTKFKDLIYNTISNNIDNQEAASIAYASLFGDITTLSHETRESFNNLSISHLLAISGSHILLLCAMLTYLLKLFKLKLPVRFVIMLVFLAVYVYFCNFSVSVVRAAIMFLLLMLSKCFKERNDTLTFLGLALIISLFICPLQAFDAGCLLSYLCVFALCTLRKPIFNLLRKIKFNYKVAQTLAPILAVQIGILPLSASLLGSVSALAVLSNFITIPLFEFAFALLVIVLPLVLIFSKIAFYILFPVKLCFSALANLASILSLINVNIDISYASKSMVFIFAAICFSISGFVMVSLVQKCKIVAYLSIILLCASILSYYNVEVKDNSLAFMTSKSGNFIVSIKSEKDVDVVFLGENLYNKDDILDFLSYHHIADVSNFIFMSAPTVSERELATTISKNVIFPLEHSENQVGNFQLVKVGSDKFGLRQTYGQTCIIISSSNSHILGGILENGSSSYFISKNGTITKKENIFLQNEQRGFAFKLNNDKISFIRKYV